MSVDLDEFLNKVRLDDDDYDYDLLDHMTKRGELSQEELVNFEKTDRRMQRVSKAVPLFAKPFLNAAKDGYRQMVKCALADGLSFDEVQDGLDYDAEFWIAYAKKAGLTVVEK